MSSDVLPSHVYESLLTKLIVVLELAQRPEGTVTPQAKQALLEATNDFKNAMKRARNLAINLPSGEIQIKEQDEIIDMLENMRDRKREQLAQFSNRMITAVTEDTKIEVDSMASTPS